MKKYLIILLTLVFACKNDKKVEDVKEQNKEKIETVIDNNLKNYETIDFKKANLYSIHEGEYIFANDLVIDKIEMVEGDGANYEVLIYINERTNIEKLNSLFVDAAFYPRNIEELELESDRKTQKKRIQTNGKKLFNFENNLILKINTFKMKPFDFKKAIFLFYKADGTVINDNFLVVKPFIIN